jgi:carbamoyl-phosphate synthase large subunit
MRSTGEVLDMAPTFGLAYFKAQEATQTPLPLEGMVSIFLTDSDKLYILDAARKFQELGFRIKAIIWQFRTMLWYKDSKIRKPF